MRRLFCMFSVSLASGLSFGQTPAATRLGRQLQSIDVGLQAVGIFTGNRTGTVTVPANDTGRVLTQGASNTVGGLVTIRYTPRPYLGLEFNGGYARFTEEYTVAPLQIQTQANEFTFGYVVTPPYLIFGVKPYASAGAGTTRFAPTRGGGQGAPEQARATYYYNLGIQKDLSPHFGARLGFRQLFYRGPDFLQNYLTINQRVVTSEPMFGLYARF